MPFRFAVCISQVSTCIFVSPYLAQIINTKKIDTKMYYTCIMCMELYAFKNDMSYKNLSTTETERTIITTKH